MGEYTLESVIDEVLRQDFMPFEEPCGHKFSLRHRRRMKQLFCANTDRHLEKTAAKMPVRKRLMIALVLVLLMTLAGVSATASFDGSFMGAFGFLRNAAGLTEVVSLDKWNDNNFISEIYKLDVLPEGYVYNEYSGSLNRTATFYKNGADDYLLMVQFVKEDFALEYNSNFSGFTETSVGGMSGYYSTVNEYTDLVWDNGEYIFELNGKFPVEELIRSAESLCIDTNYRMGFF